MKFKILLYLILPLLICGCSQLVPYEPRVSNVNYDPTLLIKQIIEEQPSHALPDEIYVTGRYLKTVKYLTDHNVWFGTATTVPRKKIIYFNSMGDAKLYLQGEYYVILIYDNYNELKFRLYTRNKDKAEKCIDSLYYLKQQAKKESAF